jgi:hypothetical protein
MIELYLRISIDHMAVDALALARENLLAVRDIAFGRRVDGSATQAVDVSRHLPGVILRQTVGRHHRARNAVLNSVEDFGIRTPLIAPRRCAQRQRAVTCLAVFAVAGRTDVVVNFPALGNGIGIAGEWVGIRRCRPAIPLRRSREGEQQAHR